MKPLQYRMKKNLDSCYYGLTQVYSDEFLWGYVVTSIRTGMPTLSISQNTWITDLMAHDLHDFIGSLANETT